MGFNPAKSDRSIAMTVSVAATASMEPVPLLYETSQPRAHGYTG